MKKIATVTPYPFEGRLLLSLDGKWISVFGCVPVFDVMIDDDRKLSIVSQKTCLKK